MRREGTPGPIARRVLRRLPSGLNRRLQRLFWDKGVALDGMNDADRTQALLGFLDAAGHGGMAPNCPDYGPPFDPPWIAFPDYAGLSSMGFRMGGGEDYMVQFQSWYAAATDAEISAFKARHPAPDEHYAEMYAQLDQWHRADG